MDRLTEMEAFVQVVDHGGFTDAARKLGLSKSAVSKHVSALEARLAVRLLNRTTRRVSPTEVGLAYYDRARSVLAEASEADSMVTAMQATPKGSLRISAPVSFGVGQVSPVVAAFLCRYPGGRHQHGARGPVRRARRRGLRSRHPDRQPDRQLAEGAQARRGARRDRGGAVLPRRDGHAAQTIDDLNEHRLLHYSQLSAGNFWKLRGPSGEERQVRVGGRLTVNNGAALMRAAEAGLGIAQVPSFMLGDALTSGRLVEVLADRPPQMLGIYALYPQGRFPQPKLRAFIDFLAEHFKGKGPDRWG